MQSAIEFLQMDRRLFRTTVLSYISQRFLKNAEETQGRGTINGARNVFVGKRDLSTPFRSVKSLQ